MTPLKRCVRQIHEASDEGGPVSIQHIVAALKDFEANYASTSDQVLALETVFQFFRERCRDEIHGDFMRRVSATIDRYQDTIIAASA